MADFPDAETGQFLDRYSNWAQKLPNIKFKKVKTQFKGRRLYTLLTDTGKDKTTSEPFNDWCKIARLSEDTVGIEIISTQVGTRWTFTCYDDCFNFDNTVLTQDLMATEFIYFDITAYDYPIIKRTGTSWYQDPNNQQSPAIDTFFDKDTDMSIYLGKPRSRKRVRSNDVINYLESGDAGAPDGEGRDDVQRVVPLKKKNNGSSSATPTPSAPTSTTSVNNSTLLSSETRPKANKVTIPSVRTRIISSENNKNIQTRTNDSSNGTAQSNSAQPVASRPPPFAPSRAALSPRLTLPSTTPIPSVAGQDTNGTSRVEDQQLLKLKKELQIKDLTLEKLKLENFILTSSHSQKEQTSNPYSTINYQFEQVIAISPQTQMIRITDKTTKQESTVLEILLNQASSKYDDQLLQLKLLQSTTNQKLHPQFLTFLNQYVETTPFHIAHYLEFEPISMNLYDFFKLHIKGKELNTNLCFTIVGQILAGLKSFYEKFQRVHGSISIQNIVVDQELKFLKFASFESSLELNSVVSSVSLRGGSLTHPILKEDKSIIVNNNLDIWNLGEVLYQLFKDKPYDSKIDLSGEDTFFKMFMRDNYDDAVDIDDIVKQLGLGQFQNRHLKDFI